MAQVGSTFRQRIKAGDDLVGTFLKTPTSHGAEIVGDLGFDFVVIDQEHAPFDRASTDVALLAARALNVPALVRVGGTETILSVLDCGAIGVLVPHVATTADAKKIAALCRYRGGGRGGGRRPRAARDTAVPMWRHINESDANTVVIVQIEDPEALDEIEIIAAVDGIDALFIGRGDLTAAFGDESKDPPRVREAVEQICAAAKKASKPICVYVGSDAEAAWLKSLGATMFVISSDQGFLREGAARALASIRRAVGASA